ncbi:MAG: inositol monophosphatase [Leptospiraceae bacterium]|nr:inositol monophosphatase [Leptospiraceae bacterium]MDW7976417.1 inositol monophosphatase family protein [Leptospiraceae bacterium]
MQETGIIEFPINEIYDRVFYVLNFIPKISESLLAFQQDISKGKILDSFQELIKRADKEAELPLLEVITKKFKKDRIISEIKGEIRNDGDFSWWIDALDGSRNFIHNNPLFCMSIGLTFRDTPVAGIVYIPTLKETYHAIYGEGAYKNNLRISVSTTPSLDIALVSSGIPFNRKEILHQLVSDLSAMISAGTGIRKSGSAVLDLCWTAEGRIDGMWERNLKPWDTCAGYVILREAGGKITDTLGNPYHIQLDNIVASNGLIHQDILNALKNIKQGDFN